MNTIEFNNIATDGEARVNEISINNKSFNTPIFMPVATRGSIKSLPLTSLKNFPILLGNTYHLYLRPGLETIQLFGGLHEFINWNNLILTDSGGFQGWSIPNKQNDEGIEFKNVYDGSKFLMTPKLSMDIQNVLNSDIAMILDQLIDTNKEKSEQLSAINITNNWAREAREIHKNDNQSLFGIVQGGMHKDLREISANQMIKLNFDGYAIGGLAIGESRIQRKEIVRFVNEILPKNKLRYVMGLGDIKGMIELIDLGVDMFDCVWPARIARHGKIINRGEYFNLKNSKFKNDLDPLVAKCSCLSCMNFSKSYLRHLLVNEPTSSWYYLTFTSNRNYY
ncbi:MAG: tRNA guanosine(34) transglycosylase Tgt [Betaproteobacteria bacterium]|nr:tRNA guanosine(34) transglycosylase Tgt [Betaproteobacteria bacterium]